MKIRRYVPAAFTVALTGLFLTSCLLPGMIPLESDSQVALPVMETDADKVLEVLQSGEWQMLQALVEERYTQDDFSKPGTLTFTANVPDEVPTYFSYGWCAVDEDKLRQNFEHIDVAIYVNGEELGRNVVHNLTSTSPDGLFRLDFGVLVLQWPADEYHIEAVATFEEPINDGLADYEPGDYIFDYTVRVQRQKEGG